ncbi:hypothetical protein DFQ27_000684 [Actinomortierella ambigua]|uniref:Rho-GAP domain-containing protein n=1 Tax=Actinomortierella ambigua TaxID=1343610 RepID=A0A9P6PN92_9FUNG|nr:hypothetical protein DFQ27_000684 [Actinomortierella ambigua]
MNIHECTNQLPDPNYATLKFLMAHLNKVQINQEVTKMGASNLGLIFGPTLMCSSNPAAVAQGNGVAGGGGGGAGGGDAVENLADMSLQCRVVETILENYAAIFEIDEEEEDEEEEGQPQLGDDNGKEEVTVGGNDRSQYVPDEEDGVGGAYPGASDDLVLGYVPPPPPSHPVASSDGLVPGGGGGGMMATSHHHRHSIYVHDNISHPTVPEEEEEEEDEEEEEEEGEEEDKMEEQNQHGHSQVRRVRTVQGHAPSIEPALATPFMNRSREFDPDLYDRRHYELDPRYLPIGQQQGQ